MKCASCIKKECRNGKDCTNIIETLGYQDDELKIMKIASAIEARYYMKKNRIEELLIFAKEMGYRRIGLAFCVGLSEEAGIIAKVLEKDFDIFSVCCKVCGIPKEEYNLEKMKSENFEATCNPKAQAMLLNEKQTDLNIIVGLCMGHDIIFTRNSEAPVTTLIVKDRVLAHNPAGAIYSGYYRKKKFGLED
ncbi:putative metal-binding protein [Methanohalophilus levihalophilus]|uniref:DUF1847 domain-containing protein n=1 Tax=Methanohalophilus levihalophilus TaxID=1431282 RepID=UPI001AE94D61|nr:DUF1847 domain-containing protein [Methanohalophilus levihalophilus]MBP2030147.1 putative metal-binding protein [Methanohalophilus levihalophilus]